MNRSGSSCCDQCLQGRTHDDHLAAFVDRQVVADRLDPVDRNDRHHAHPAVRPQREPFGMDHGLSRFVRRETGGLCKPLARARERLRKQRGIGRLEQVVDRLDAEGIQRELRVGGDEDHQRTQLDGKFGQRGKTVLLGHRNVQEHQCGAQPPDRASDHLRPVGGLADDLDIRMRGQRTHQPLSGQFDIVDHQHPQLAHRWPMRVRNGSPMTTRAPPSCGNVSVRCCSDP